MRTTRRTAAAGLGVLLVGCATSGAVDSPSEEQSQEPSARPTEVVTASPTSAPGTFGADDLDLIVLTEDRLEPGMTLDDLTNGFDALQQPVVELEHNEFVLQPGWIDARLTRIGTTGEGSYWEEGGYVTWASVYETDDHAETTFAVLIEEHASESGWGLERIGHPPYGDQSVALQGEAYGWDATLLNVWRDDNLLLAAGAFGVTADDGAEQLAAISDAMDMRADDSR